MNQLINGGGAEYGLLPNVRTSTGFQVQPRRSGQWEGPKIIESDQASITSDCRSSVSNARSTSELTVGDDSSSWRSSDLNMDPSSSYGRLAYMQPAAPQTLVYDPRFGYHVPSQMPRKWQVRSPGYTNTLSPPQMHTSPPQHFGHHNMVPQSPTIPMQQWANKACISSTAQSSSNGVMIEQDPITAPQDWARTVTAPQDWECSPISSTAMLASNIPEPQAIMHKVDPVSYARIQETNCDNQSVTDQMLSPNVFSSVVSTPLVGHFSPSGYLNSPSFFNSPLSYTLRSCFSPSQRANVLPSVMNSLDVPPVLHLNNQKAGYVRPNSASCSINSVSDPSVLQRLPSTKLQTAPADNELTKLHISTADIYSVRTPEYNYSQEVDREESPVGLREEVENVWVGNYDYKEYNRDGGSNLFITYAGTWVELRDGLRHQGFEVRRILTTGIANLYNVVFENHTCARKAFTTQREICLRMVPPRNSIRNWLRMPSPKFPVKFETKFRLAVRSGKAACNEIVGEVLMSNFEEKKGCVIWADQLKGHRIRIVGCEGLFLFPNGKVVELKEVPSMSGSNVPLGWISYRCKQTRRDFVTRRSGNLLRDYIYYG